MQATCFYLVLILLSLLWDTNPELKANLSKLLALILTIFSILEFMYLLALV